MNKQPEQEVDVEVGSPIFQYLIKLSTDIGVLILISRLLVSFIVTRRRYKKQILGLLWPGALRHIKLMIRPWMPTQTI